MRRNRDGGPQPAGRGSEQRHPRQTYGVGIFWYFLLGLVLFWVILLVNLADSLEVNRLLLLLAGILLGSVACFSGWRRYRIDERGVEVRSLSRRGSWTWDEIGGISGTRIERGALGTAAPYAMGVYSHPGASVVRYDVRNAEGRLLFRISPWIRGRKALAAEIRRRTAAIRREAAS